MLMRIRAQQKENQGNLGRANKDWLVLIPSSLIMYLYIHNNRITKQNTITKTSGMDGWKEGRKKKKNKTNQARVFNNYRCF